MALDPVIKKISSFTELTEPADGDMIPIVDVSELAEADQTKRIAYSNLVPPATTVIKKRQGGDELSWWIYGTDNFTPPSSKIQVGVSRFIFSSSTSVQITVTFPEAFEEIPIVIISDGARMVSGSTAGQRRIHIGEPTKTSVIISVSLDASSTVTLDIPWMAIGQ